MNRTRCFLFFFLISSFAFAQSSSAPPDPYKPVLDRLQSITVIPLPAWQAHAANLPHGEDPTLGTSDWQPVKVKEDWKGSRWVSREVPDHRRLLRHPRWRTGIQADFNAVQQVTYTDGQLYGAMDTGVGSPTPLTDGIAWFNLNPSTHSHGLSVQVSGQGYVNSRQNLLYPDVVVNGSGQGYVVFSVSGAAEYPSPGYIAFDSRSGPTGNIRLATVGSAPEDGFTCYPAPSAGYPPPNPPGGCRWGDYSGGAEWDGQFFMMAEYIPPSARDTYVNWGTFVWTASSH